MCFRMFLRSLLDCLGEWVLFAFVLDTSLSWQHVDLCACPRAFAAWRQQLRFQGKVSLDTQSGAEEAVTQHDCWLWPLASRFHEGMENDALLSSLDPCLSGPLIIASYLLPFPISNEILRRWQNLWDVAGPSGANESSREQVLSNVYWN